MSLDVYLNSSTTIKSECEYCGSEYEKIKEFYHANITHNLGTMAEAAGIYKHLWRPEELEITTAKELIAPLTEGLKKLKGNPDFFKQYNASNGWGVYEHFVPFVEDYLNACIEFPDAIIEISR
ncbi:hypothetical protein KKH23_07100 [Patescibacteria group bacterium]|uniref:Uncharacterized protein n=1 Tax=viral metagenome TaxID=1070528 RepID=A0A6M3LWK2_9ZZZZ|nr:hypothetical protein [Patescibacteria group bacterium]